MKYQICFFALLSFSPSLFAANFLYQDLKLKQNGRTYEVIRVTFPEAQKACEDVGARLPTNREWALEIQRLSGEQTIFETSYPQVELPYIVMDAERIKDPDLKAEALRMKANNAYLVPRVDEAGRWVTDFYYRPGSFGNYYLSKEIRRALGSNKVNVSRFYTASQTASSWAPFIIEVDGSIYAKITPLSAPEKDQYVCLK